MLAIAYPLFFTGRLVEAAVTMLLCQAIRQVGHFFYERTDPDVEKKKFGHKDRSKKIAAGCLLLSLIVQLVWAPFTAAQQLQITLWMAFVSHAVEITHKFGWIRAMDWWIKIFTDPMTDAADFLDSALIPPRDFFDINPTSARSFVPSWMAPSASVGKLKRF